MSRTYSTITWGLALVVAALVLNWQQSIPWAIASAGAVAVAGGVAVALLDVDAKAHASAAAKRTAKPSAFLDPHSDSF